MMAMMSSLAALSADAMLPALAEIGGDLGMLRQLEQLIVSVALFGHGRRARSFGPVSDGVGGAQAKAICRVHPIYAGIADVAGGDVVCGDVLAGRLLRGIGIAGPRNVSMA
ncbi:MAG: hypothetical protein R2856_30840 [Caldilineaceae bacterium]